MSEAAETTTMDVVVHKANVPTMAGESLDRFTSRLSEAARSHVQKKFNLVRGPDRYDYTWVAEAFSNSVVMSVDKGKELRKLVAIPYTRDGKTGIFTFGEAIEVERKVTFVKKPGLAATTTITKSTKKPHAVVQGVEQLDVSKGERQMFGNDRSQWVQTSKSFWGGINLV